MKVWNMIFLGAGLTVFITTSVEASQLKPAESSQKELVQLLHDAKPIPNLKKGKVRSLKSVISKATAEEKSDLVKLLNQIQLKALKSNKKGQTLFSVIKVEPNTVFSREGLKAGDLVWQ